MKDLAYFIGSIFDSRECESTEKEILNIYFKELKLSVDTLGKQVDFEKMEREWRCLYPFAWADFIRFLMGWRPGHWKINDYSLKMLRKVQKELE